MEKQQLMGILNIYKEKGWTSFDVVAKIRRLVGIKKVGHTGTLDPEAEGVLPICIGKATKVVELLSDKDKTYTATCRLGIETDTQDHTGVVLKEMPVDMTEEEISNALISFIGNIEQVPPMYSALKVNGKKLYQLAREGKVVERKARPVSIKDIQIHKITGSLVEFSVTCSKGTYVRTICHDLGNKLGCGGHMTSLVRDMVEPFHKEDAMTISQLEMIIDSGKLMDVLMPVDGLFQALDSIIVHMKYNKQLFNGNKIPWHEDNQGSYKVYSHEGQFMGIYTSICRDDHYYLKPEKLFI